MTVGNDIPGGFPMAKLRLIHNQTVPGDILISDIDQGMPVEHLDMQRKQDVYVTYHKKSFVGFGVDLKVNVDRSTPGYIDLVLSDKVKLSQAGGDIAGLSAAGLIQELNLDTGIIVQPTVLSAYQDLAGGAEADDDYRVNVTGTDFGSLLPVTSSITLSDGVTSKTFTQDEVLNGGGNFNDFEVSVPPGVHGFATDGSEDITSAVVTANGLSSLTTLVIAS